MSHEHNPPPGDELHIPEIPPSGDDLDNLANGLGEKGEMPSASPANAGVEELAPRPSVTMKISEVFAAPVAKDPFGARLSIIYAATAWTNYEMVVEQAQEIVAKKALNPMHLDWAVAVDDSQPMRPKRGIYERLLEDPESDWAGKHRTLSGQYIVAGRSRSKFGPNEDPNAKLSGIDAMNRINDDLGLGTKIVIPLVHSGITISVYAPTDSELLILEGQFGLDKVTLAQQTMGLTLSNTTAHHVHPIIDFILDHVYDATCKDRSPENLKRLILSTDVSAMLWGMAAAIYPNGYPYAQPCVHDLSKCDHVDLATININKLFVMNRRKFSVKQLDFMIPSRERRTNEEVLEYQRSCEINSDRTFPLTDSQEVTLRVPNLMEFQESGYRWIEELKTLVEKTFGKGISERTTDAMIMNHGQATIARQYGHFVRSLRIGQQGVVEDQETLSRALGSISSNDEARTNFGLAIDKFIEGATASLVAIPAYNCPKCQKAPSKEYSEHPKLMPVDILQAFTVLLTRKLITIQDRKQ